MTDRKKFAWWRWLIAIIAFALLTYATFELIITTSIWLFDMIINGPRYLIEWLIFILYKYGIPFVIGVVAAPFAWALYISGRIGI